jgi:hypothetical protein
MSLAITKTKTLKIKVNQLSALDLCNEYRIPYFKFRQGIKKDGEKYWQKGTYPENYKDWDYDTSMEWNNDVKFEPTHIYILLAKGENPDKFMIIDFDEKEDLQYLDLFGDDWKTKSSRKQLPHLWRLRKENDYSKCSVKISINGIKTNIDLKYFSIVERIDSKIEYTTGDFPPEFDFQKFHPRPISEKPQPKTPTEPSQQYSLIMNNYTGKRFIDHLQNIDHTQYTNSYCDWLKIGFAIKRIFYNEQEPHLWFEILKAYSELSADHKSENTDDWEKMFEAESKCGIPTILEYSQKSNEEQFNLIETDYFKNKRADKEDEHSKLLNAGYKLLFESVKAHDEKEEKIKLEYPSYDVVKDEFEKTHCLIVHKSIYITETKNDVIMFKEANFTTSYRHLKYYIEDFDKKGKFIGYESKSFIKKWYEDEYNRKYDDMAVYPPPLECPDNIFNLWKPFNITKYTDVYEKDEEGLQMFLDHIKILCGNDPLVADYIVKWFAQMFQYPATKTIVPTFISDEGAGKGSILEMIGRMMGNKKTLVTTTPGRDVWGQFNSLMSDSFLVNLNEMSIKETTDCEGKIKGLITDPQLTIYPKGINPYGITSFHRFIITTQNENPVKTRKDDRRNLIIRSSDEKCEDKPYFIKLREKLEDINVMRTIYDHLMAIEGMDKFVSIPMPKTEWQNDMKETARSYYDMWLEDLIRHSNTNEIELSYYGQDQMDLFYTWCQNGKIKYETNFIKMGLAIKRMKIPGITKKIDKFGTKTVYNIAELKKHYKIGCLIDI